MIGPCRMLWQRYIYKETCKTLLLSLLCFFLLFSVIDYSVHMRSFIRAKQIDLWLIAFYYGMQFIRHMDLLLPLALLTATIKVLRAMSERHELLALQAAGIPSRQIVRPFLFMASTAVVCNFVVAEFCLPTSAKFTEKFQISHLKPSALEKHRLRVLELKDGSRLAFQRFDSKSSTFHDLFWVRSSDDLWRIKTLTLNREDPNAPPLCSFVDHIARGQDGGLHKVESFDTIRLAPLKAGSYKIKKHQVAVTNHPLSKLYKIFQKSRDAEARAEFFVKCIKPFLSLLVVLAIIPYCLRFSRLVSSISFYSLGIFGAVAYFVVIQAGGILAQNQTISPWVSMIAPFVVLISWFTLRFVKV